uniref:NADH dehydrogenase subunit 6 n=1 Tax=Ceraphronidae sp. ZJUH_2016007 TaxID=2491153 RepID=A0A3S8V0H6_9HYME|nr:NADH dehydrogenase subunit 6 [Ceraphronidae sp. ZJUH_2016007]
MNKLNPKMKYYKFKFMMIMKLIPFMILIMKKTPISMLIYLMIYCIIMTNNLFELYPNKWMIYMVILMITGGMLIIFLYTTSIVPNIANPTSKPPMTKMYLILIIIMIMNWNWMNLNINNMNIYMFSPQFMMTNNPTNNLTLLSIIYLLTTMFVVVKIIKTSTKSMRQF